MLNHLHYFIMLLFLSSSLLNAMELARSKPLLSIKIPIRTYFDLMPDDVLVSLKDLLEENFDEVAAHAWKKHSDPFIMPIDCTIHRRRDYFAQFNSQDTMIVTITRDGKDSIARIWDISRFSSNPYHIILIVVNVEAAAFHPRNNAIITGSPEGLIKIWDVTNSNCLATLKGHRNEIKSIKFDSQGTRMITASRDQTAKIWDYTRGLCIHTLKGHSDAVNDVQFNSDDSIAVTASDDKTAKMWDTRYGDCIATLQEEDEERPWLCVSSAEFNSSNNTILTNSGYAKIWSVLQRTCMMTFTGHEDFIWTARFNSKGTEVITASNDSKVKIWNVNDGSCSTTISGVYTGELHPLDTKIVLLGSIPPKSGMLMVHT